MNDPVRLAIETCAKPSSYRDRLVIRSRGRLAAIALMLAASLAALGCDRSGEEGAESRRGAIGLDQTAAGNRQLANEFLVQVARRRQIAANQRAMAAKQAASEVIVTKGATPTRNARLKTELEALAAAVDRRADEAQALADFHLGLAGTLEGAADAGVRR